LARMFRRRRCDSLMASEPATLSEVHMASKNRRLRLIAEIAEAVRDRSKKPRNASRAQLANLERAREADPLRGVKAARCAPRCSATNREGRPCMAPAMRGTDRCAQHGGRIRAGAHHKGNQQWLLSGKANRGLALQEARREGREALDALSPSEAMILADALPRHATGLLRAKGAIALRKYSQDGGRAWIEWLTVSRH